jgi:hypothetical protein
LGFIASLWILKCLDYIAHSDFIQEHLSESGVQLYNMMQTATDATLKSLIFSRIKAANQDHQSINLSKFQANIFCLGCYILD